MPLDAPNHIACQLPAHAYYQLIHTLRLTLPPPLTDSADDLLRRDHAAIARIAALVPANAAEADVAAQYVAASEQWKDCLRLAQLPGITPEWAAKCRAQAAGMMRQANSALRLLLRVQDRRQKLEADNAACDRAAWTEHCALGLMAEALAPAAAPEPQPSEAEPSEAPAEAGADLVAEAEHDAAVYPERAALIRAMGRVPDDAAFGPPDDDLAQALVTARASVPSRDPASRVPRTETAMRMTGIHHSGHPPGPPA